MDLRPGEDVLYEGRPSWRALFGFYVLGLLGGIAIGVIVALAASVAIGAAVGVVIVVLTLVLGYVRRMYTRYAITDRRLRIQRGIISRNVQETKLDRVQNVNYRQGALDRLLGVGNVDFDTAGTEDSNFTFEWVNHPERVVQAVDKAQAEAAVEAARLAQPPPGPGGGL
ncbi:MAG: PH domain-containing protein [Solirubrobacteraceae bacterium]